MRVTVYRLERIRLSASGNPRFKIHTDKGVFVTASDYSFVYGIENDWKGKDSRPAEIQVQRSKVTDLRYLDQGDTCAWSDEHFKSGVQATRWLATKHGGCFACSECAEETEG